MKAYRFRSSVTGRYVTPVYAKRYPHLTVREAVTSKHFNEYVRGKT